MGCSSGAAAAFTMAWNHPEWYQRVISYSGTYVNQQWPYNPATPGGAGTKQGLIVYLFRRTGISKTVLLAFSVGMNIAVTVANLVMGLIAIGMMAGPLSFKRLRSRARAEQPA